MRNRYGTLAGLVAAAALTAIGPDPYMRAAAHKVPPPKPDDAEKMSRQRKRYLQRQARKRTKQHMK